MSARHVLLAIAAVFLVAGLALGVRTVKSGDVSCGSVFSPSTSAAKFADRGEEVAQAVVGGGPDADPSNNVDACRSAISDAKPLAYGGLGLGALALIASFVASPNWPVDTQGNPKPSIWR